MKYCFALCAILLLVGCSGQKRAETVFSAIERLEHANSVSDFEARLRDAEKELDDSKGEISSDRFGALLDYKFSITGLRRQLDHELYMAERAKGLPTYAALIDSEAKDTEDFHNSLEACRDDAWRAVYGTEPTLSKTRPGDCRKLDDQRMERIRQERAKDIASKK